MALSSPMPGLAVSSTWTAGLDQSDAGCLNRWLLEVVRLRSRPFWMRHRESRSTALAARRRAIVHAAQVLYDEATIQPWATSLHLGPIRALNVPFSFSDDEVDTLSIWPGKVFIYGNLSACSLHSCLLIGRLACLGVMYQKLERLTQTLTMQEIETERLETRLYDCAKSIRAVVDEVCALIPYSFGLKYVELCGNIPTLPKELFFGGGALYMWNPLLFALSVEGLPLLQRRWIRGRLRWLGERIGV